MAVTFITVHGTGDHLEDASDRKWWEPNSDFSKRLLSEAGGGKVVAFKWSGANDEIARREAAEDLLWKLRDFDERGEEVVLVGHSHGGSVINTALKLSMSMQRSFSNIKSVITVGTPFIRMKPQRFLWERLNFAGQLAFLYSVSLFLLLISAIATIFIYQASTGEMTEMTQAVNEMKQTSEYADNGTYTDNVREMETTVEEATQEVTVAWATVASSVLFIVITGYILVRSQRRIRSLHDPKVIGNYFDTYGSRFLPIYDKRDEAINGLMHVYNISLRLMQPEQSAGILRLFLVVIAVFFLASSVVAEELAGAIEIAATFLPQWELFQDDTIRKNMIDYSENSFSGLIHWTLREEISQPLAFELMLWYNVNVVPMLNLPAEYTYGTAFNEFGQPTFALSLLTDIISVLAKFAIVMLIFPVSDILNKFIFGQFFAGRLNRIFGNQVKRQALGNTTKGEDLAGVARVPQGWPEEHAEQFPDGPSIALCNFAAEHARETLLNVQNVLAQHDANEKHTVVDALTEQLSWRELIHTAYFRVPESRDHIIREILKKSGIRTAEETSKISAALPVLARR